MPAAAKAPPSPEIHTQLTVGLQLLRTSNICDQLFIDERPFQSWQEHCVLAHHNSHAPQLVWIVNQEDPPRLVLAPGTVTKHLERLYARLGAASRTAAPARVFGGGL